MKHWFKLLPIHQKLITLVFGVSAVSLVAAAAVFVAFDLVRFRISAADEAQVLAQVIAENTAAAIVFDDVDAARQTLASVRVRTVVVQACVYRADGSLLTSYRQSPNVTCPLPPADRRTWKSVGSVAPVTRNGKTIGAIYVQRALSDLGTHLLAALTAGGLVLLTVGAMALGLAQSLQRTISQPIVDLAKAARAIGGQAPYQIPPIVTSPDETGELVRAFSEMVRRIGEANIELHAEVDQRRQMQAEREGLLLREREASRLKDEFLAALSHELRTPLNAILGWTQILTSTPPSRETLAKAVASLSRNAHAQNRVIEDLLDISRIITGKMQLSIAAVDARSVVESALEVVEPFALAKRIQIETRIPAAPCIVQADYDRLRQIVWNLLSNAVKFTPAGGTVAVRLNDRAGWHDIEVSDTGIGIAPEFLPHVFERFRQADGSMTREHGGLGLGLAIVKELTETHGGAVRASSDGANRGATFTVSLPDFACRAVGPTSETVGVPALPRLDGVTVLAVDDNLDALDIVASALSQAGAAVRTASSGSEALTQWRRASADVVVCDLAMSQMDGFEVLKQIRQFEQQDRITPVLAVSAYASDAYRVRCLAAGFRGYIAKPYNTADLVRAVAAAIEQVC